MIRSVTLMVLTLASTSLMADSMLLGNAKQGKRLYKTACLTCHASEVYTRPNRTVKSIGGLVGRVGGCSTQLNLDLKQDQINDLVKYLNDTYYKFK